MAISEDDLTPDYELTDDIPENEVEAEPEHIDHTAQGGDDA